MILYVDQVGLAVQANSVTLTSLPKSYSNSPYCPSRIPLDLRTMRGVFYMRLYAFICAILDA